MDTKSLVQISMQLEQFVKSISFKEIQECSYKFCSCSHKKEDVK